MFAASAPIQAAAPLTQEQLGATTYSQEDEPATTYGGIDFAHLSFEDALSRAERTGKVLVILWVGTDKKKERTIAEDVFGDSGVQSWMKENATAVWIDASVRKKGAKKAGVMLELTPVIDILDIGRGGRIDRIRLGDTATQFLAAVLGIGEPERPSGDTASEPFSWLAWGNAKYRDNQDLNSGELAVQAYKWCLENGEAARPGFRAKYLEFLLQRIAQCKQRSPSAITLLESEYARLNRMMVTGLAKRADVYEITRVAFWLRKEDRLMEAYKALRGGGESSDRYRRWLLPATAPILGRYEQYEEMLHVVGDYHLEMFQARIDSLSEQDASEAPGDDAEGEPEGETEGSARAPENAVITDFKADGLHHLPFAIQDSRADIIDDASWVYEALLSVGRGKDAKDLMLLITTTFPVNKAFGLFIERAQRLKLWAPAVEIADIGMAVLDERGQRRMQRLLQRIPTEGSETDADKGTKKGGQ